MFLYDNKWTVSPIIIGMPFDYRSQFQISLQIQKATFNRVLQEHN